MTIGFAYTVPHSHIHSHASIQLTVDTSGHLIPGANRQPVDRVDDATIRNPAATGEIAALGN